MGMPTIPDINPVIDLTREDAINLLLVSIAFEELGLSHIINAEGEKIQDALENKVLKCLGDYIELDEVVIKTLQNIVEKEMLLKHKLDSLIELIKLEKKPKPCK